jgi:hypothetical protein
VGGSKLTRTKTRALRTSVAVVAGCLLLLGSGAAWAQNEPPPNPEELWDAFPLDPQPTTPSPQPKPPTAEPDEPTPRPTAPLTEDEGESGWSPLLLGGLAGSVLLVVAGLLLMRGKRRPAPGPPHPKTTDELIARAYALAAECDMLLASYRDEGVDSVSENADHDFRAAEATPGSGSSTYAEIGERVAGVLSAAEAAAEQIRADARLDAEDILRAANEDAEQVRREAMVYDTDTRAAVDAFATERRREAEQQVQKQLAEAEKQARATREAAEQMAHQIEEDGRVRGEALREESRSVEERLKKALVGLRRMTAQLEELVGTPAPPAQAAAAQADGESLADALRPYGQRQEELEPLVEER